MEQAFDEATEEAAVAVGASLLRAHSAVDVFGALSRRTRVGAPTDSLSACKAAAACSAGVRSGVGQFDERSDDGVGDSRCLELSVSSPPLSGAADAGGGKRS